MFYRRLRKRIGVLGALAVSTILWILLVVAIIGVAVGASSLRLHWEEGRVLERAEGYDVVSEHVAGGSRTGYSAESTIAHDFGSFGDSGPAMAMVMASFQFDDGGASIDRYLSIARMEGWELDDPEVQELGPGTGEWGLSSHGILYGGGSREDERGTLFGYCDEMSIEAWYSDLEDQATLSIRLYADSSGCYSRLRD